LLSATFLATNSSRNPPSIRAKIGSFGPAGEHAAPSVAAPEHIAGGGEYFSCSPI